MALRTANNPVTSKLLLGAMAQVIVPNTRLTLINPNDPTGASQVYIRAKYQMSQSAYFPAIHLSTGQQQFSIDTNHGYEGGMVVLIEYYDKWDQSPLSRDVIIQNMDDDIERVKANIEDNSSLIVNGFSYAVSCYKFVLNADRPQEDNMFPGANLLYRTMAVHVNIPPYYVA